MRDELSERYFNVIIDKLKNENKPNKNYQKYLKTINHERKK